MKTKTFIVALILCSIVMIQNTQAQIVMHESGSISLLESTTDWNKGLQIYHNGVYYFNTEQNHDGHWVTIATPGHIRGKCWIVTHPASKSDQRFFVTGEGTVYKYTDRTMSDSNLQSSNETITRAEEILDGITGTFYTPIDQYDGSKSEKRKVGVSAQDVEKVLPEAVSRDDNDLMYVDYEALTVVLIEAYKEQKAEIELLRKTLEEHGLLKPEK